MADLDKLRGVVYRPIDPGLPAMLPKIIGLVLVLFILSGCATQAPVNPAARRDILIQRALKPAFNRGPFIGPPIPVASVPPPRKSVKFAAQPLATVAIQPICVQVEVHTNDFFPNEKIIGMQWKNLVRGHTYLLQWTEDFLTWHDNGMFTPVVDDPNFYWGPQRPMPPCLPTLPSTFPQYICARFYRLRDLSGP